MGPIEARLMRVDVEAGIDQGIAWHFGNPAAEGRAVAAGQAAAWLENRPVLEIQGADRLTWLHSLTTGNFEQLASGEAVAALALSPTGQVQQALFGIADGERLLCWTEPGKAQQLLAWLESMRFMMRVEISLRTDLKLGWVGSAVPVPEGWLARSAAIGGFEVFAPAAAELPAEATPVGAWALEAARIACGVPRIFLDTDHKTLPNELGLFATELNKGCYCGQETVARVHNVGRPPRRLVRLHLDGSAAELPEPGSELLLDANPVGFVGGSALHHELGPISLGLIRRNVELDVPLTVGGIAASQEMLVDPDVGLHVRANLPRGMR